jgi:hypothetical protein
MKSSKKRRSSSRKENPRNGVSVYARKPKPIYHLGVNRGAYYQWVKHGVSERKNTADAELIRLIRQIAARHHLRYGNPRVRLELRQAGQFEESSLGNEVSA